MLTQGFDAPAVRALFVARPTFSPNLYQQMIGRGLRGPLNGGKPECLIVNVADNFFQFGEELAFRKFEYLWDQSKYGELHEPLTSEQQLVVGRAVETKQLVTASAGTGKTYTLIHRARRTRSTPIMSMPVVRSLS